MPLLSLATKVLQVRKDGRLSEKGIKQLQQKRFKEIVKHAINNSKFYRDFYGDHGLTVDKINDICLADLPVINKQIMMDNYDDFVTDSRLKQKELEIFVSDPSNTRKKYLNKFEVIHTSGSTGRIGIFVYGEQDWDWLKAIAINRVSKTNLLPNKRERVLFIGAVDGRYAGVSLVRDAPKILLKILELDINKPTPELQKKLSAFKPDIITGYASGVYYLAKEKLAGTVDVRPKRIMCSADILQPSMHKTIKDAFGMEPTNFYAASESISMAIDCEEHDGMHLFTDWHCFEILNEDNQPAPNGKSGKLVLTNLYNYTQPLIRYDMHDQIEPCTEKCSCGSPFPKIKSVTGRQEEFLWLKKEDGTKEFLHPAVFGEFFVPGLKKLQVKQTSSQTFTLICVVDGDVATTASAIHTRMDKILQGKGFGDEIKYDVNFVDKITNDPRSGKFKIVVPKEW
jgi:putative adenylate-forming enzyme